jgi:hypothetical protein
MNWDYNRGRFMGTFTRVSTRIFINIYQSQHLQTKTKNTVYTLTIFKAIKFVPMYQNRYAVVTFLTTPVIPTHVIHSIYCPSFSSYSTKTK